MSGVLVVMEQRGGVLNRMSLEAVAAGQLLAAKLGLECSAAVLGEGAGSLGAKVGGKVYSVDHALLKDYTADGYVAALEQLVKKLEPKYVLFPHTYQVRDFAPKLATRFGQVLMSDVVAIHDGAVGKRRSQRDSKFMARSSVVAFRGASCVLSGSGGSSFFSGAAQSKSVFKS